MRVTFQLEGDEIEAFEELCNTELRLSGQMAKYLVLQGLSKFRVARKGKEEKEIARLRREMEYLRGQAEEDKKEIASLKATPLVDTHFRAYTENMRRLFEAFTKELIVLAGDLNGLRREKGLEEIDVVSDIETRIREKFPISISITKDPNNNVPLPTPQDLR